MHQSLIYLLKYHNRGPVDSVVVVTKMYQSTAAIAQMTS